MEDRVKSLENLLRNAKSIKVRYPAIKISTYFQHKYLLNDSTSPGGEGLTRGRQKVRCKSILAENWTETRLAQPVRNFKVSSSFSFIGKRSSKGLSAEGLEQKYLRLLKLHTKQILRQEAISASIKERSRQYEQAHEYRAAQAAKKINEEDTYNILRKTRCIERRRKRIQAIHQHRVECLWQNYNLNRLFRSRLSSNPNHSNLFS
eukprot:TRINITY_DN19356_c0_g1_i2.p1 TRINITY_DN19356_c0_g1~~TRINITY_DN19356_c0_g1_i2.p1  ORF type:complete len:205 (-),score=14.32 TRINITY_DN19356_c0_g1_i2:13-627(-)